MPSNTSNKRFSEFHHLAILWLPWPMTAGEETAWGQRLTIGRKVAGGKSVNRRTTVCGLQTESTGTLAAMVIAFVLSINQNNWVLEMNCR